MALPLIILLLLIYGYTLLILLFFLELEKDPDPIAVPPEINSGVSIVVPYRNEAAHLQGLLEDLSGQSYPPEYTEVLLVDDHSGDDSALMAASVSARMENFHCLSLPSGITGKKKALDFGIRQATFERIIQVDADCRLDPGFIATHMAFLETYPADLVAGFVTTRKEEGSFLEIFDRLDMLSLIGSGAGSFQLGSPMMCSGANLSYTRELFRDTRPFDPEETLASGDDMFLMIGARKLGRSLAFISNRESIVRTSPQKSLGALLKQRVRWASKADKLKMPDIQLLALLVVLTNISILLMPLWIILYSAWWPWLAGAWVSKTVAEFLLLYRMTGICGSRNDLKFFLPVSLLYYPYFAVILVRAIWFRPLWKDAAR